MLVLPDSSTRVTAASYPAFQAETSYVPAGTSIVATPAPSVAALNAPTRTWTSSKRSVRVGSRDCDRDAVFRRSDNNELESGRRPLMPRRGCSRPDVNGPGVLTQRGGCGEIEVSPVQRARVRPRCRPKRPSANCQTRLREELYPGAAQIAPTRTFRANLDRRRSLGVLGTRWRTRGYRATVPNEGDDLLGSTLGCPFWYRNQRTSRYGFNRGGESYQVSNR